jgi:alkylation response protein AidB-like acyl-CoA dehydrogenase
VTYAADVLLSEEQLALRSTARQIAQEKLADLALEWDARGVIDHAYLREVLGGAGLLGMTVPVEYGGAGSTFLDFIVVLEELAARAFPAASLMQATCSGPPMHIIELASEEVKREVLPRIVAEGAMCSVAMTEPDAGSDLGAIRTRMVKDGGDVVIDGQKIYVGGGGEADYYITYARASDAPGTAGLACVLVPKDAPGLSYGPEFRMLAPRGVPRREVIFDHCRVPERYVLAGAGEFKKMITTFNAERLHNATFNLGLAQGAYDHARAYAAERSTFGKPLSAHQGIRWKLAEMLVHLEACRWLVYGAARAKDAGKDIGLDASIAKYYSAEHGFQVADQAMQIEGAYGIHEGLVQIAFRNIRAFRVAAGSSEMMLNYIGRNAATVR